MPAMVTIAPNERAAMGFAIDRSAMFYSRGGFEQRESSDTLSDMLRGLENTPPGAVEMDFLLQDAYLLGIRLYASSVELEEYWLDARQQRSGARTASGASGPEADLDRSVRQFFPEAAADPMSWSFDQVRGIFTDLGFRVDAAVSAAAPRARAMYNADREEMVNKANAIRERNARIRSGSAALVAAGATESPLITEATAVNEGWGIDVPTGLSPDDIPVESFRALVVGSVTLLITNYGGRLAAIQGSCSHQSASLVKGKVQGAAIQCPRHGSEFDLRSGKQLCPPFCQKWMDANGAKAKFLRAVTPDKRGGDLLTYPLRVEHGEIIVRI